MNLEYVEIFPLRKLDWNRIHIMITIKIWNALNRDLSQHYIVTFCAICNHFAIYNYQRHTKNALYNHKNPQHFDCKHASHRPNTYEANVHASNRCVKKKKKPSNKTIFHSNYEIARTTTNRIYSRAKQNKITRYFSTLTSVRFFAKLLVRNRSESNVKLMFCSFANVEKER